MKSDRAAPEDDLRALWRLTAAALVGWTLVIAGSLAWNVYNEHHQTRELSTKEARAHFNKDQAFRFWAARHGGVYVPTDAHTPPNPKLEHVPERDIETPSGRKLTLMNPAYMLRQVMSEYAESYGIKGKITSFKLFNAANAPDEWETGALHAFEAGVAEVFERTDIDGEPHLRLMRPMIVKEECVKCHGAQGYKVGDVRGGVGVAIPMAPYLAMQRRDDAVQVGSHGVIWLVGLGAIGLSARRSRQRRIERHRAAEALEEKARELKYANEELQQFAFAAAHDLQEPLRAVVTHTQVLQRRCEGRLDDEAAQSIGFAVEAAKTMRSKIADIQAYLRVAKTVGSPTPEDLNAVVAAVLEEFRGEIAKRNAAIHCGPLPQVVADRDHLVCVFRHLIGNALMYHEQSYSPEVFLAAEKGAGEWIFSISDNGIGIAPEYYERVFGVFKRLHSQDEYPGTGMGLAICKKIIERHGGRIWVQSEPGKGSTFLFTLPMMHPGSGVSRN